MKTIGTIKTETRSIVELIPFAHVATTARELVVVDQEVA